MTTRMALPPQVTQWQEGWLQIKVPLPYSLKWVNSYLIAEPDGYTIIDPGLGTEDAKQVWEEVLTSRGLCWQDIKQIVLTHQHPDHYGLAGYIQQLSGAPVYISAESYAYAQRLWGTEAGQAKGELGFAESLAIQFAQHGMPPELVAAIAHNLASFRLLVLPHPQVTILTGGDVSTIGGEQWQILHAPGHARGQLCFYQPERRWILCGDQVMPRISPNISIVPGEQDDPLAAYLQSLAELSRLEVDLAFPGHRDPFSAFGERIEALQGHHQRRLQEIEQWLAEKEMTCFEVCNRMFGTHLHQNPHNLRFAMSEALAHIHHLVQLGRVEIVGEASNYLDCRQAEAGHRYTFRAASTT